MAEYLQVGRPAPRVEGPAKVTGQTVYADDIQLSHMLHAKVLRSPLAHARIKRIDTSRAQALEGVEAVVTAADLPPVAREDESPGAMPSNRAEVLLAADEVIFAGQPVAAVLASDPSVAEEALDLIEVEYEELPAVLDPLEAMKEDAPPARGPVSDIDRSEAQAHAAVDAEEERAQTASNVASQMRLTRGDVEQGFAEADVVVERTWRTPMVHQAYIEPHISLADYHPATGTLTVWTGTQGQFFVRDELSRLFRIPETKVRVISAELGGAFGGKVLLTQPLAAALAMVAKGPVKLVMSRSEDLTAGNPAPSCVVQLKTGMKRDGALIALQGRIIYESGAFPGSPIIIGALLLGGYYRFPHLDIQAFDVMTNKVPQGAYRAPGAPQVTFAIENHMDMMARELNLDPLEVRLQNAVQEGDPMPNERPYPRIGFRQCLEAIRENDIWRSRGKVREAQGKRRGVGLAAGGWLSGRQPASAIVKLNEDGTFGVVTGSNDITGTNTTFAQIAAEELRQPLETVSILTADTATAPFAGITGGSKAVYTVGRAVKAAAEDARGQLLAIAAQLLEVGADDLELACGQVQVKGTPDWSVPLKGIARSSTDFGGRYPPVVGRGTISALKHHPGFSVQVAEVEADPETGKVTVLRWAIAQDVGFAINPLSIAGQMEGATAQGLGMGLFEEMLFDDQGRLLNPSLLDCHIPTAADVPPIETIILEVPSEEGPYGARGVGEPPVVAGSAVIANAISDALGVRVSEAPITPERILRALGKVRD
ncbi:MAG: xanthine dehydrogenase family protein molybdopterin-binding subunit [Dehalococcoidia bacterium]